jgi:hypothetical protein
VEQDALTACQVEEETDKKRGGYLATLFRIVGQGDTSYRGSPSLTSAHPTEYREYFVNDMTNLARLFG